jgi:PST family polysaccharide transporter
MSLAHKTARGAAWTILSSLGGRAVGLISTLVITRFITPREYGAVSVATVLTTSADEFTRFGLYQYVIAKPTAGRDVAFHASLLHLSTGVIALLGVLALRTPLARLFEAPMAAGFVVGLTLASLFDRIATGPEAILHRDMRFGVAGAARAASEFLYAGLAVALAIVGFGGDAIVYGNIAQWGLLLVIYVWLTQRRDWLEPHPLCRDIIRRLLAFGVPLSVGHLANFASRRWDNLLFSRFFGAAAVGRYNLAYNLADIPATHIGEHIGDVLLPSFARVDVERGRTGLVKATRLLVLIMFPLAVGLGTVATTLTSAVFDPRWVEMGPMLAILSSLSVVRPIGWTIDAYLQARDRTRLLMVLQLGKVIALLAAVAGLAQIGPLWACIGVGVAFGLHALAGMLAVRALDQISLRDMLAGVIPPFIACLPMVAAILAFRQHVLAPAGLAGGVLALLIEVALGGCTFVISALILAPTASRELLQLIREAIFRRG